MSDQDEQLKALEQKLNALLKRQEEFSREIQQLRSEIVRLRGGTIDPVVVNKEKPKPQPEVVLPKAPLREPVKRNMERFIGENLAGRIGIVILIIGVGLGLRYAIQRGLLGVGGRVALGAFGGSAIFTLGLFLKKKYHSFSAVLVSGGIAILYLTAFSAYGYFHIINQALTFVLMTLLTALAVYMAVYYNTSVIAHFGLVGAYITPFLLSNNEGNVPFLFAYMSLVNAGILVVAWFKNWRSLHYTSLFATWLIFSVLSAMKVSDPHFLFPALFFSSLLYCIFYLSLIGHQVYKKIQLNIINVILILVNAFVAYLIGKWVLESNGLFGRYSGLFTLLHSFPHLLLGLYLYRSLNTDRRLVYLCIGLFLVFITVAIPVQFDGHWVTLLWISQAGMLFTIARIKKVKMFEYLSYPLYFLAIISLLQDWGIEYQSVWNADKNYLATKAFLNIRFLSSLFFASISLFMCAVAFRYRGALMESSERGWNKAILFSALFILFFSFYPEIKFFLMQTFFHESEQLEDLWKAAPFLGYWLWIYSALFFTLFAYLVVRFAKDAVLCSIAVAINVLLGWVFLAMVLRLLSNMRDSGFMAYNALYGHELRYLGFLVLGLLLWVTYKAIKAIGSQGKALMVLFDLFLVLAVLWAVSSEVVHHLLLANAKNEYRFGLSIWWAVFAAGLVVAGIYFKKKHLRIASLSLFAVTILKVLIFDTQGMENGPKTILYIAIGILLVLVSYLYNKYRHTLFGEG